MQILHGEIASQSALLFTEQPQGAVCVGDAVAIMKQLETCSIPLIIADPPYGIGYHSNHYKDKNPYSPVSNDWNFQISRFLQECSRVLVDGGALYLFCRWDVSPIWLPQVPPTGLKCKTKIIWLKDNWSAGDLEGCFGNQYEEILFITKGRHKLHEKRWPNVWPFPRVPAKKMLHPTQKPVPLIERAILSSSDVGDKVLDPFCGSGSTGVAASNTGRGFLLSDIDPKMARIASVRLGMAVDANDDTPTEPQPLDTLDIPDPSEWGIHPEELQFIYKQLRGNHLCENHTHVV